MKKLLIVLALGSMLPGCELLSLPGLVDDDIAYGENELSVTEPEVSGQLGDVSASASASYVSNAYGDTAYANVDVRTRSRSGVLMNMISLEGLDSIEIGRTYVFNDSYNVEGTNVFASVVGCSGPDDGVWTTDTTADRVEVQVEAGPQDGTVEVHFNADFDNGDSSQGSFVMPY